MRMCIWAPDTDLLADGTVNVQTTRREHLAIYISIGEVNLQQPSASTITFSSLIYGSLLGRLSI